MLLFGGRAATMLRTTIQLTREQYQALQTLSQGSQKSMARLIRQAIDQFLLARKPDRATLYRLGETAVGQFASGRHDVSAQHDKYLDEAFEG